MARQDEDIELVLGNKQLLSLFFVVVLFFAAFFSVGYTVGFGHGEASGPAPTLANADTPEKQDEPSFPQSLYKEAPAMPPAASAKQSPTEAVERAVPGIPKLSEDKPEPKPTPVEEKPKPTMAKATPPKPQPAAPKKTEPAKAAVAKQAEAPVAGAYHLQVAALRVPKDAEMLAGTLKEKGYPAAVEAGQSDGWNRVLVGPFQSAEAAKDFRERLKKDGFDTMLRKQ